MILAAFYVTIASSTTTVLVRRSYLSVLFFIACIACARAQSYTGYDVASYTGVYGTLFNPANILDHRFRADVNLLGFGFGFQNNVLSLDLGDKTNYTRVPLPITKTGRGAAFSDILGPGFMLRLNDKNAIAVTSRFRFQGNADRLDPNLLNIALQDDPTQFNQSSINIKGGSLQAHAWNELAFTYSRQIGITDYGVWKAAVSLKLLGGQGGAYLTANHLSFTYNDSVTADVSQLLKYGGAVNSTGNININYSDFMDDWDNQYQYKFFRQPGVGADIGVTYEYRDVMQVYETAYNEETNNYRWKAGASISDIGSIRYRSSPNSYNTHLTGQQYIFQDLVIPPDSTTLVSIANFYKRKFPGRQSDTHFTMDLPTTLHLTFDYSFNPWLSAAAHFSMPIITSQPAYYTGTHTLAQLSVTPRAELSWVGFYLPFTYQFAGGFQSGMAFRLGPLTIGSASLINLGVLRKGRSADAYFILRVPLFKPRPYENEEIPEDLKWSRRQKRLLNCPK